MENDRPRRAALYARVSTGEQTTQNQLIRLREVAERAGWDVVATYDETASGVAPRGARSAMEAMVADARRRRFDLIAAVDVSRLGRSLHGLAGLFEELRQIGCDLYLDREAVDTTTPAGRALLGMASVFAAFERDMVVERTKAGLARARLRGSHIGRPPTGDGTCEAIRSLRAQGLGINKIARELRVGKSVVQRVANEMRGEADGASA
ncbi:MAG: recombinase family protein [Pseudomonadota bacterium]